jgi:hypothetical protein
MNTDFYPAKNLRLPDSVSWLDSASSEKPKEKNYRLTLFTKIILRSFGYGLPRKPLIFQARYRNRPSTRPTGRGLACFL